MPARFGNIKFNLMRAIEMFQDMNDEDMDVSAPPSDSSFYKEYEVAQRLNEFLGQLQEEGIFDGCDFRDKESSYDEEESSSDGSIPESGGFTYDEESDEPKSHESFTGRFKRYVRRMLPRSRPLSNRVEIDREEDSRDSESSSDGSIRQYGSHRSRSKTRRPHGIVLEHHSWERDDREPHDKRIVYEHEHPHKHNHPNSHHHHSHSGSHVHTYHSHDGEPDEEGSEIDEYDSHGLSGNFRAQSDTEMSSGPRSQSRSSSKRRSVSRESI